MTLTLVIPFVLTPLSLVKADSTGSIELSGSVNYVQEKDLEEAITYIMDEATIYSSNGDVVDIDFNKVYAKYGYSDELKQVEEMVKSDQQDRADSGHCAVVAIQDTLGVSAINGLISGGIIGLLRRKAAAEIAKLVARYAFKSFVPAATAASLIWSFGRCMWF